MKVETSKKKARLMCFRSQWSLVMGHRGKGQPRIRRVQGEGPACPTTALGLRTDGEPGMVCYWAAGWANLGMWKSESAPPRPSLCSHTGTAALLGQPSVSQESFLPRERQQSAFMESKLEEVASPAQGKNPSQCEKLVR